MPKNPKDSLMMVYDFNHEKDLFSNVSDLWDDLSNSSKSSLFFYPATRGESRLRLLGPHFTALRVYIPSDLNLSSFLSVDEFKMLLNGNDAVKNKTINMLREKDHKPRNSFTRRADPPLSNNKTDIINKISDKTKWQACVTINGYLYDVRKVQIVTFTLVTLNDLKSKVDNARNSSNKNINGILAHDVIIINNNPLQFSLRNSNQAPFQFNMGICEEATLLSKDAISQIFTNGLLDIPKVLKYSNNTQLSKMSGYFYILKDMNFKAPEEFMQSLKSEDGRIRQDQNLDEMLGYDKENIPFEAIEDQEDSRNPIMNMEIE